MSSVKLGEVCILHYGKSLQGYQDNEPLNAPVRVFGTNGPIGWTKKPLIQEPTIVIGRKGAYRGVHFSGGPSWTIDTAYFLTLKKTDIELKWLYYRLLLLDVNRMDTGAAIPSTKREDFYAAKICIPSTTKQIRITSILSTYDNLIENNQRRIQLLEQAARLLYKEWFVYLRFPGHEHVKIKDGVPEGWVKGVVSNFYDTASGGTPSRKNPEFYSGDIKWVKTQELQDSFLFDTEEHITDEAIKKSAAKVFPTNTVLIAMYGATIGQVGVIVDPSSCNQACCAVMPKAEGANYEHAFLFFLSNKDGLRNLGQGAAQKNISQQVIRGYEMIFPDKLILEMFRNYAKTFLDQIRTMQATNRRLSQARDLLLPRLMNGEVTV